MSWLLQFCIKVSVFEQSSPVLRSAIFHCQLGKGATTRITDKRNQFHIRIDYFHCLAEWFTLIQRHLGFFRNSYSVTITFARFKRSACAPPAYCGDFSIKISEDRAIGKLKLGQFS